MFNNIKMSSLEQIKQLTKRRVNGLFFIKNKHAVRNFKNHSYFQDSRKVSATKSTYISQQNQANPKWRMFVKEPTDYGINNTYQYLNQRRSRKYYQTLNDSPQKQTKMKNTEKKFRYNRLSTQPNISYNRATQSFYYRINKKPNNNIDSQNSQKSQKYTNYNKIPQHILKMTYISEQPSMGNVNKLNNINSINLNLLPYIIRTFVKCKINFQKTITSNQYTQIKQLIYRIFSVPKTPFDIKDLISLNSIEQILEILQKQEEQSIQWIQTIRYFFIAPQEIAQYQFSKLIDQLKMLTVLNFNECIQGDKVYVYRIQDRIQIRNIYGFLKEGTYIYGTSKNILQNYEQIERLRKQKQSYQRRIKRWRNIANYSNKTQKQQKCKTFISQYEQTQPKRLSTHEFNSIYEHYKKKHQKKVSKAKHTNFCQTSHNNSVQKNSFIDRSKFSCSQDIFE